VLEEPAAGALEALVERTCNLRWNRAETHPLSLRRSHFLLARAPARILGFRCSSTARHRICREPLAQLLR
jgi:hypothetical protein